jgi:microtubule-associated protein-like 1/2
LAELKDSKEWIEVMAFSPDGQYLAVGSHDNMIRVYSTADWSLTGNCRGHSSYIMALDWCKESKYLRTNCGAYELLFWTVPDCK